MVIRIYWASVTGNRKIAADQARIRNLVTSLNIETQWIDITTSSEVRQEMRKECGIPDAMPPQIFKDDDYLGDMIAMEDAVEEGKVKQWFHVKVLEEEEEEGEKVTATAADTMTSADDVSSNEVTLETAEVKQKEKVQEVRTIPAPMSATITAKVVFPRSKTNHISKSTLDSEERRKKILGL